MENCRLISAWWLTIFWCSWYLGTTAVSHTEPTFEGPGRTNLSIKCLCYLCQSSSQGPNALWKDRIFLYFTHHRRNCMSNQSQKGFRAAWCEFLTFFASNRRWCIKTIHLHCPLHQPPSHVWHVKYDRSQTEICCKYKVHTKIWGHHTKKSKYRIDSFYTDYIFKWQHCRYTRLKMYYLMCLQKIIEIHRGWHTYMILILLPLTTLS